MQRLASIPRLDWRKTVTEQGLLNVVNTRADGSESTYWNEQAQYEISLEEVTTLEETTDELYAMVIEACKHMVEDAEVLDRMSMPRIAAEYIRESLVKEIDHSVYGRFDLAFDGTSPAKMLEFNADTPAALFEAAVTQWYWLESVHPARDQWNLIHERLTRAWQRVAATTPDATVHFAVGEKEPDEDWVTVAYLRDTARDAGVTDFGITLQEIGWASDQSAFVDGEDRLIHTCFKMWPWEWMFSEPFGAYVMGGESTTRWIEPAWKVLAGSKAILPVLWHLYPNHPNLVPAYFDNPNGMIEYAAKPIFGWEGSGVEVVTATGTESEPHQHTRGQNMIYQQYIPLPTFDGNRAICGTWVIDGEASGLGIRESDGLITNLGSRFVPHYINAPRSTPEQVATWTTPEE